MINKILAVTIIVVSLGVLALAMSLIADSKVDGWAVAVGSVIGILVGVVTYRHGLRSALGATGQGAERPFK